MTQDQVKEILRKDATKRAESRLADVRRELERVRDGRAEASLVAREAELMRNLSQLKD
jgi:hypothetical protein